MKWTFNLKSFENPIKGGLVSVESVALLQFCALEALLDKKKKKQTQKAKKQNKQPPKKTVVQIFKIDWLNNFFQLITDSSIFSIHLCDSLIGQKS